MKLASMAVDMRILSFLVLFVSLALPLKGQALPDIPSTETYETAGIEIEIDPRPHTVDRDKLYATFRNLGPENQEKFLKIRRQMLTDVLNKLKLPRPIAFFYSHFTSWKTELEEEGISDEFARVRPIKGLLRRSLQVASDYIWKSQKVVLERYYNGKNLTFLLTAGWMFTGNRYRAIGLNWTWFKNKETGEESRRVRWQIETIDPNSTFTFIPLNLGFTIRYQKNIESADGEIPVEMRGRTVVLFPVITTAESQFTRGGHGGLNIFTSPFLLGLLASYFHGDAQWAIYGGLLTPFMWFTGLSETYGFIAKTYPLKFWEKDFPPVEDSSAKDCGKTLQ